jgi:hypothetical protein
VRVRKEGGGVGKIEVERRGESPGSIVTLLALRMTRVNMRMGKAGVEGKADVQALGDTGASRLGTTPLSSMGSVTSWTIFVNLSALHERIGGVIGHEGPSWLAA